MSPPTIDLLAAAQAGDQVACTQLLRENERLIWSIVRRYLGQQGEMEDLYQLGCIGFLKAVRGFDTGYGTQFSTYAVPKIAGEIRRFLRDDGAVKVSRSLREQGGRVRRAQNLLQSRLGREPTLSELAQETGLTVEELALTEQAAAPVASLQAEVGERGRLEELLGDDGMEEALLEKLSLQRSVAQLPQRERQVIELRYYHGLTQTRAAQLLHVSQVQVSRIERKALDLLRTALRTG